MIENDLVLRLLTYAAEYDAVPHAIFWRSLRWFAAERLIQHSNDELDEFYELPYCLGNRTLFTLRHYRGHPELTVTLYLPFSVDDDEEIQSTITLVVSGFQLPERAVAWRRGQDFEFGVLRRPAVDRLREREARLLALKIASEQPDHSASTEMIKKLVPTIVQLSSKDLEPSPTRVNEQRWQQIVGNVISHQNSSEGPFRRGYAIRTADGLRVTARGLDYLKSLGFSE